MNRVIEITIAKDGRAQVETKGFAGSQCRDASRFLENALGQKANEVLKPEFHQSESLHQHIRSGK
ncbi:DUF2997 domain-containing protein [Blastopirellula marina]|uniref:DUF2997 domain-containing protein n=1 Tax=Blastopirellula marina TaxID=124 RepID=A0A2S8F9W4_9BACT|nr:DUF2997 domain-containing protein [Blastopirellula marina]PQO28939.1 hypothetical protein C5Y98_24580 [Blastopirellula marina]PTL42212.1 DUF2997 domain-containing protein [Blastopirellula marina]